MQSIQQVQGPLNRNKGISPLHVLVVQPSLWERIKTKVQQSFSTETVAEITLGAVTMLLTTGLLVGLARALAHYTIIPAP
jgi:hypothetical protein